LDQFYGRNAEKKPVIAANSSPILAQLKHRNRDINVIHSSSIVRPQGSFKHDVDNSITIPFVPKLKEKPNALIPFDLKIQNPEFEKLPVDYVFPHPYENEIRNIAYPAHVLEEVMDELMQPEPLESSPCTWVETLSDLEKMVQTLSEKSEIAVDLEHHSYRSYNGFLCLMQISSRDQDYLIDTLTLRTELHRLNRILTDPKILKVCFIFTWTNGVDNFQVSIFLTTLFRCSTGLKWI
jgi:exosome complex exonuclease RRP6